MVVQGKIDPHQYRIMVVDDDSEILSELQLAFEDEGYGVVVAGSGNQALERLAQGHLDLVLSDIHMPEGDGQFLLQSVRAEDPAIPFFIMTGFNDFSPEQALERGCTAFFKKPLDVEALLSEVESALFEVYASRGKSALPAKDSADAPALSSVVEANEKSGGSPRMTSEPLVSGSSGTGSSTLRSPAMDASGGKTAADYQSLERRLAELEDENARLVRAVADITLEKIALQEALSSKS